MVEGSLDLSAQATVLFIRLGHNWRCLKVNFEATDESGQRCVRCWLPFCAFLLPFFGVARVEIHLLRVEIHLLTEQSTLARC